jgi:hypothetical protein
MTIEERRAKKAAQQRAWRARNPERAKAIAAAYWKAYYEKNKAKLYEKKRAYLARNPEKLRRWKHADYERHSESYKGRAHKRWREKNNECRAYYAKRYRENQPIILARNRDYMRRNREKVLAWRRSYFKTARGRAVRLASDRRCVKRATAYKNAWAKIRRRTNMSYAIEVRLRARMGLALRKYQAVPNERVRASLKELLGCTVSEARAYLQFKFLPGMSWDNRELWHIDHIRPCASFDLTDLEQQKQCFHYTNLQPLWATDNHRKGAKTVWYCRADEAERIESRMPGA